jgi:hypothetical protein
LRYVLDANSAGSSTGLNCSLALDVATTCAFCRSPHRYVAFSCDLAPFEPERVQTK